MSNSFIHWLAEAWRKDSVGEAGGANGREAEGGVVSWTKWAESAYSIGGGGQQPSERGGTRLPDQNEGGADPEGRGVVLVWKGDPVRVALVPVNAGCGGLWKGESVGWRYDVSIFLRWRPVQISSELPSYLSSMFQGDSC